jgi:hypothetical protein
VESAPPRIQKSTNFLRSKFLFLSSKGFNIHEKENTLLTLASIALTADALLTNPFRQGQAKVAAKPIDIKKE